MTPEQLLSACKLVVSRPEYKPSYDKKGHLIESHCNQAVTEIAKLYGVDFTGLMANGIINRIGGSDKWEVIDCKSYDNAFLLVSKGDLLIAGEAGSPHGHVTVLCPLPMEYSGSYGCECPMVANVGKGRQIPSGNPPMLTRMTPYINNIERLSLAFHNEPVIWHYKG